MDPQKRAKLIASAIELFAAEGIHSASTNHIARAAGVAAGTLFNYFATKEELVQAAYLECKSELIAAMRDEPPDDAGFRSFLRNVWTRSLEWGLTHPTRHNFLRQFSQLPEATRSSPEIKALLEMEMQFFFEAMDRAQAQNEMIPIDREYMSLVFGAWFDATLDYLRRLKKKDRAKAIETSFNLLWRTVAVDPSKN